MPSFGWAYVSSLVELEPGGEGNVTRLRKDSSRCTLGSVHGHRYDVVAMNIRSPASPTRPALRQRRTGSDERKKQSDHRNATPATLAAEARGQLAGAVEELTEICIVY